MPVKPIQGTSIQAKPIQAVLVGGAGMLFKPLDIVLNYGGTATTQTYPIPDSGSYSDVFDTDLEVVPGLTVTVSAVQEPNSAGRGNTGDTTRSLTNDDLLKTSLVAGSTVSSYTTTFSGSAISGGSTYTVKVTGSRSITQANRKALITVGGSSQVLDATDNPPDILTFLNITGSQLMSTGILCEINPSSDWAYISGVRITEN